METLISVGKTWPSNIVKTGMWETMDVCDLCHSILNAADIYDSLGICPHCGKASDSAIVQTREVIYRKLFTKYTKWWQFWKDDEYFIEPKNIFSESILSHYYDYANTV